MVDEIKPDWAMRGRAPANLRYWAGGGAAPLVGGHIVLNAGFARDDAHALAINDGKEKPDSALYRLTAADARSLAENLLRAVKFAEQAAVTPSPHQH
jgi:hypothetical protein